MRNSNPFLCADPGMSHWMLRRSFLYTFRTVSKIYIPDAASASRFNFLLSRERELIATSPPSYIPIAASRSIISFPHKNIYLPSYISKIFLKLSLTRFIAKCYLLGLLPGISLRSHLKFSRLFFFEVEICGRGRGGLERGGTRDKDLGKGSSDLSGYDGVEYPNIFSTGTSKS